MQESVVIIGASGHGKVVADIVKKSGHIVKGFLDDAPNVPSHFVGFPVLGKTDDYSNYMNDTFVIGIGNSEVRERIANKLVGVKWHTAIHPNAVISDLDVEIDEGTVVMANAVINAGTKIGKHCIVNTGAIVEHDNRIEDYCHVSVGAKLAGTVSLGKKTWVGIGAAVSNNLTICSDCMIGAGAVVIRNIKEPGVYTGVPAERKA